MKTQKTATYAALMCLRLLIAGVCLLACSQTAWCDTVDLFKPGDPLKITEFPVDVNKHVIEGDDGYIHFHVTNVSGGPVTVASENGSSIGVTTGDPDDWAKLSKKDGNVSDCTIGLVLAANDSCSITLHFVTDALDYGNDSGITTFRVLVGVQGGGSGTADAPVRVSDLPEPSTLFTLGSGVLGLSRFLRKRLLT
jgi:hypothetical protein